MADTGPDSLEKHRQRLEESLDKLRKALKHWQVYSAEYEGLREELLALPEDADRQTMLGIAKDFGGSVVTEKEVISFLGDKEGIKRTPKQVADAVKHRIEYVQKNAEQVQTQLDKGEGRLNTLKIVSRPDQVMNEDGLPIMDIKEELDEEGNVITSSATEAEPQAIPMNLKDIQGFEKYATAEEDDEKEIEIPKAAPKAVPSNAKAEVKESKSTLKKTAAPMPSQRNPKKQETKVFQTDVEKLAEEDVPTPATIKVVEDAPNEFANAPHVEESEEDAKLRREMIKYQLGEVGAIVAELDLEEVSEDDDEKGWEDEEEEEDDEEDEDEDEYGRSTKRFITDDLREEMEALQRKLLGSADAKRQEAIKIANEKEAEERRQLEEKAIKDKKKPAKKGVRFSEKLDISEAAKVPADAPESPPTPSILDMVFGAGTKDAEAKLYNPTAEAPKPKGPSLFKKSRKGGAAGEVGATGNTESREPAVSRHPIGDIMERPSAISSVSKSEATDDDDSKPKPLLSNTIMERPPAKKSAKPAAPSLEADELDPDLHMQEVAMEHFHMRNRLIQRQGGFIERDEERAEKSFDELDENGEPLKISRFKAARVRNEF